jgi:hypothetical protein
MVKVNDAIAQSKERSPFEKCVQLDKDENLQIAPPLSQESIDLAQFAEDLRYRIAISPLEKVSGCTTPNRTSEHSWVGLR